MLVILRMALLVRSPLLLTKETSSITPTYSQTALFPTNGNQRRRRRRQQQQLFSAKRKKPNMARMFFLPNSSFTNNSNYRINQMKNLTYRRQESCLVFPPPRGIKPIAIIQFLGGAFLGAVPEVTYSYLIERLTRERYLVVSVPYDVTFDHSQAAFDVYERFNCCLDSLLSSGFPYAGLKSVDLLPLPVYSVGHSNGALLQLLVGSYFSEKIPKANAIISFNNRPASEAVPYFEQVGPLVRQTMPLLEASPIYEMARSGSGDLLSAVLDIAGAVAQGYDPDAIISLNKFVNQLPSVMKQVTEGTSEFKPTPSENRELVKQSYNAGNTLLVKFSNDAIDETDLLESILRPRLELIGGKLEKVTLPGNHITPCVQDIKWQVGEFYTPVDAVVQGLQYLSLNEIRSLSRAIVDWLKGLNHEED